jgi:ANTAR domain
MCDQTRKTGVAHGALLAFFQSVTAAFSPAELAAMFATVERELALAEDGSALDVLVRSATEMVPGAQMAGVSIGRGGTFSTPAATDDAVLTVDQLQYVKRSGPCVDAIVQDTTFNTGDLRSDTRWPSFGRAAFERTGIISMLSFRMFFEATDRGDVLAGLNMYSREPHAFAETSEVVGMLLATHGALAVAQMTARAKADNLMTALKTSRDIGVAMGILMQRYKITRDDAFNLLRMASQALHRKVAEIAVEVADTGELPELPDRRA